MGRSILEGVSEFLTMSDVKEPIELEISDVKWEMMTDRGDGTEKEKAVLMFKGAKKGLVVNKTNARWLAAAFGEDSETYTGRRVVLARGVIDGNSGLYLSAPVPAAVVTGPGGEYQKAWPEASTTHTGEVPF